MVVVVVVVVVRKVFWGLIGYRDMYGLLLTGMYCPG